MHTVQRPRRVEDLVPAVLRVDLREHEELGVGGVVPDMRCVRGDEIVHLVWRESEAEGAVRLVERLARGLGGLVT